MPPAGAAADEPILAKLRSRATVVRLFIQTRRHALRGGRGSRSGFCRRNTLVKKPAMCEFDVRLIEIVRRRDPLGLAPLMSPCFRSPTSFSHLAAGAIPTVVQA